MRAMPMLLVVVLCLATAPAAIAGPGRWIEEGKLGLLDHDIGIGVHHTEDGADLNGELLFASPSWLGAIGAPRPHLGASINSAGATSYAYTGLTWTAALGQRLFAALGLGGAVHDGEIDGKKPDRLRLGSRFLFHEEAELGWRLTASLSVSVFLDHISNADLARHNAGLTNIGLRTGFVF